MTKLTKELFEGHTYGELVKLTGLTDRQVHMEACRLGLLPEGTPMTAYWKRCVEREETKKAAQRKADLKPAVKTAQAKTAKPTARRQRKAS